MKVEVRRKIFSVIMAMSVFISALAMPVFFRDVPGAAVAYADEYTGLRVNNTGAINTRQDDECQISLQITNTRDAEFSFDGAKLEFSKTEGLTISGGTKATVSFASRDDQAEISFTVKANRFCDTGTRDYRLILTKDGETVYTSRYFSLNISQNIGSAGDDEINVNSADIVHSIYPENGFATGSGNSISFRVYNNGNFAIRNAQIKVELPEGISIDNGSNLKNLGTLSIGKSADAQFPILVEKDLDSKSYVISAELIGINNNKESVSIKKDFYVPVTGDGKNDEEPDSVGKPQLMVTDFTYGGSFVQAGTQFPLNLSLLNTSKESLYNVKVTISSDGDFVPVNSNAFYVDKIGASETYNKTVQLSAKNDAAQQTTAITVSMSYENADKEAFTSEDTISVPVTQRTRLVVDEIVPPMECYVGNIGSAEVDFYNMGKTVLSNLRVNATGNFDVFESNSYYAGNMEGGRNDSYSFTFMPREVGPMEGVITFTYEDAAGNAQYLEVPFTFEAQEMPVWDDSDMFEDPEPEKTPIPWSIIIAAIVIVVLIIAAVIIKKILKKRKERAFELEDMAFTAKDEKEEALNIEEEADAENAEYKSEDGESTEKE